ncbi:hypothetical protein ACFVWR_07805 [Leifsonia sp. NPDC058292]|uniref:hypothetical protein n=1 Tax=Leifsonia sp. NPDC058292 TaxID=3346428 RepID=UPI0036D96AAC
MDDLTGSAEERARQLEVIEAQGEPDRDWLRRQLALVLQAWGDDETIIVIEAEGREDF